MKRAITWIILLLFVAGCVSRNNENFSLRKSLADSHELFPEQRDWLKPFDRSEILDRLAYKLNQGLPLIVHTLVPLCDNQHQFILPTTPSLGDGFNLKTNLYWATRHGMKRYFQNNHGWKQQVVEFTSTDTILERVAFKKEFEHGAEVILICDAYRGDQMNACLTDYFNFLAGLKTDSLQVNGACIQTGSAADMIVFNGHNGISESGVQFVQAKRKRMRDAVVIACSSYFNFSGPIQNANCFPLVTTTESMYPGATVLDKIIEKWAALASAEEIRLAAANGYNEMKDCGFEPADKMFYTGW